MEKQMMFMLKCLVERKTYRGGDRVRKGKKKRQESVS